MDPNASDVTVHQSDYHEILTDAQIAQLEQDFRPRLKGACYLDHAGATLHSKTQMDSIQHQLQNHLFSNPHSRNPSSTITSDAVDYVRLRILQHFNATWEDYAVIFTSGATAAIRLVGEAFTFNGGTFAYLEESHTSIVGLREIVGKREIGQDGAAVAPPAVYSLSKQSMEQLMKTKSRPTSSTTSAQGPSVQTTTTQAAMPDDNLTNGLVAYPAQCNFSGYKYPLDWIPNIKQGFLDKLANCKEFYVQNADEQCFEPRTEVEKHHRWYVLLDAASFVGTSPLDLSIYKADFVPVSFYKMFGFPTGLGALIVRREAAHLLKKDYFGGGTVNIAIPSNTFHAKRLQLHERFEDGTISFLSILALRHGFDALNKLPNGIHTISERTFRLARYFHHSLRRLTYEGGHPVAVMYSDTEYEDRRTQGPVVTFNLLRPDGSVIGYSEMEQMAYLHDVHLRYGCFCNVGACRRHLGLLPDELLKHYEAGHVCGDMMDLMDGKPTGGIRASFGYMTSPTDVDVLLGLIQTCWVRPFQVSLLRSKALAPKILNGHSSNQLNGSRKKLSQIFVYPIKSCAGFEVSKMWPIGNRGLLYDREWLIVNSSGVPLTQKREPRLCRLRPHIDISSRRLVLSMDGYPDVSVPLEVNHFGEVTQTDMCTSRVCGDTVSGLDCGPAANDWISLVLDRPGLKLIRFSADHHRKPRNSLEEISLANSSQFLMISTASTLALARKLVERNVVLPSLVEASDAQEFSSFSTSGTCGTRNGNLADCDVNSKHEQDGDSNRSFEKQRVEQILGQDLIRRFRPNFVITDDETEGGEEKGLLEPYFEEQWSRVQIGSTTFRSGGPCMRCATICADQSTGERGPEPFLTLSATRNGRPNFGIHLYRVAEDAGSSDTLTEKDINGNRAKSKLEYRTEADSPAKKMAIIRIGDHVQPEPDDFNSDLEKDNSIRYSNGANNTETLNIEPKAVVNLTLIDSID